MSDADLSHHYRVLKQFLDISDDSTSRAKSNSTRAARAREKLLRLSSAQFRELSTDVYDELRRRIDESRSEPDFLLPKSTFHPKRNQARQKLSSLPQSRFKDLVSDISYEIERRHLHQASSKSVSSEMSSRDGSRASSRAHTHSDSVSTTFSKAHSRSKSQSSEVYESNSSSGPGGDSVGTSNANTDRNSMRSTSTVNMSNVANSTALYNDLNTPELKPPVSEQAIGIQSATVVPAKAVMSWSSDEENEDIVKHPYSKLDGKLVDVDANADDDEGEPRQLKLSNAFNSAARSGKHDDYASLKTAPVDTSVSKAEYEELKRAHDDLLQKHESLNISLSTTTNQLRELENSKSLVESKLSELQTAHSGILSKNKTLEDQVYNLTEENQRFLTQQSNPPSSEEILSIQNELKELKSLNASLRLENQSLKSMSPRSARGSKTFAGGVAKSGVIDYNSELKSFFEKLDNLPKKESVTQHSRKENHLKDEISLWQKKYESLKTQKVLESKKNPVKALELGKHSSPTGLISLRSAAEVFSLIDVFFTSLDIENPDSDLIFEQISSIAVSANKIAKQGSSAGFGESSYPNAIRESASHALTATRYHITHHALIPKVIVERSVSELAFTVCDAISSLKIKDETAIATSTPDENRVKNIANGTTSVKPLRMAQKLFINGDSDPSTRSLNIDTNSPVKNKSSSLPAVGIKSEPIDKGLGVNSFGKQSVQSAEVTPTNKKLFNGSTGAQDKSPRANILDKVKHFENQDSKQLNSSSLPLNKKTANASEDLQPSADDSVVEQSSDNNTTVSTESTPVRNKSIFQSLRDRFTSDNSAKSVNSEKAQTEESSDKLVTGEHVESKQESDSNRSPNNTPQAIESNSDATNESSSSPPSLKSSTSQKSNLKSISKPPSKGDTEVSTAHQDSKEPSKTLESKMQENLEQDKQSKGTTQTEASNFNSRQSEQPTSSDLKDSKQEVATKGLKFKSPSFRVTKVGNQETQDHVSQTEESDSSDDEETERRQRQDYRKSMAAATFNFDLFDIDDPDNTLTQLLLYLEHQTVQVIATIQDLLSAIKKPDAVRGELRNNSSAISEVIRQMTEATNTSMNQTRNFQLKEHGSWVVKSLDDCNHRMNALCKPNSDKDDSEFADRHFKQRLAGISFDIAKCTKELVKTVEEASLKEDIAHLDARLNHPDDLT